VQTGKSRLHNVNDPQDTRPRDYARVCPEADCFRRMSVAVSFDKAVPLTSRAKPGGARRDRTDDLMLAKHALSQLSYGPVVWVRSARHQSGFTLRATPGQASHQMARQGIACVSRRSLVGPGRVERPTSRLSGVRSNHLSYEPGSLRDGAQVSDLRAIDGKRKRNEGGG
jgi:hypothetical protein